MIAEGLKIMVLGMGTVFVMLAVLVAATILASRVIFALEGPPSSTAADVGNNTPRKDDGRLAAVIAAAIARFRKKT